MPYPAWTRLLFPASSINPLNFHEWPQKNFSLQFLYSIKPTSDENKEKYQLGVYKLMQYQILQTNITRIVWQTIRRITNEILGVKRLSSLRKVFPFWLDLWFKWFTMFPYCLLHVQKKENKQTNKKKTKTVVI